MIEVGPDAPPEKVEPSLCRSSVSTTATITDPSSDLYTEDAASNPNTRVSMQYEYRTARTNYSWWRATAPDPETPEFNTPFNTTDPLDSTRRIRFAVTGANVPGLDVTKVDLATFIVLFNTLSRDVQVSDYKPEPVIVGKLWHCTASVDYVLIGA